MPDAFYIIGAVGGVTGLITAYVVLGNWLAKRWGGPP
jgi:membrane associated rhomboid family serine protease